LWRSTAAASTPALEGPAVKDSRWPSLPRKAQKAGRALTPGGRGRGEGEVREMRGEG